jgi:hypothetical protein
MVQRGLLFATTAIFMTFFLGPSAVLPETIASAAPVDPAVSEMLDKTREALGLAHRTLPLTVTQVGTLQAGGLQGTIQCEARGENSICHSELGPQTEWIERAGATFYRHDSSGLTRSLNGALLAHNRTLSAIEDYRYLDHPEWLRPMVPQTHEANLKWFRIHVPGGDAERMAFNATTGLLVKSIAAGEEGPQTSTYSDWRNIDGVQFASTIVESIEGWPFVTIGFNKIILDNPTPPSLAMPGSASVHTQQPVMVPLISRDEHLYAPVEIAGQHYEFLLDSGSQTMVLDRRVAKDIALPLQGNFTLNATQRMNNASFGQVTGLHIGGAAFDPQFAVITDLGTTTDGGHRIDGILGFPIFAQAAIRLDTKTKTLTIAEPGKLEMHGHALHLSLDRGVVEVDAGVVDGPRDAWFMIDTGSTANILLYQAFAQHYPNALHIGLQKERTYGIGGSVSAVDAQLAGITLYGMPEMHDLPIHLMLASEGAFGNRIVAGSLGLGLLGDYQLDFDVQNGLFELESPPKTSASPTARP